MCKNRHFYIKSPYYCNQYKNSNNIRLLGLLVYYVLYLKNTACTIHEYLYI